MTRTALFALAVSLAAPAQAQQASAQAAAETSAETDEADTIIVTAPRIVGSVETDVPPDLTLNEDEIAAYGASSVTDLVAALSTQTRTGRGRGGGAPVVLVNGRRVSGFAEIRDIPPEAIRKVETFPEEVALKFGYSADQRVINFVLKDDFRAVSGEVEYGGPTAGGRDQTELQATYLDISKAGRLNLSAEYDRDTNLSEAERGIVQPVAGLAEARSLLAASDALKLNGVLNRGLGATTNATLNLTYNREDQASEFGLSTTGDALRRDRLSQSGNAGITVDGNIGRWRWTGTGNAGVDTVRTLTDTVAGSAAPRDSAFSRLRTANANLVFSGPLVELPAGPVTASLRAGYERRSFSSRSSRSGTSVAARIGRGDASSRVSLDIPLASRRRGVADALGDLSINVNGGYRHLSAFGGLRTFGYGLNWSPAPNLNLSASIAAEQAAPSQAQLRDPLVFTPNVTVFDFVRGTTALVTQISGGNTGLRTEERRDAKAAINWEPKFVEGLGLSAEYFRNRASDPITNFPVLTAEIEQAFPGRVVRDAAGTLISIDNRAINYAATASDEARFGLNFSKNFGPQGAGPGGPGMGRPPGAGPRAGGGGGGFGRFGGGAGKRLQTSLFYTHKFRDEILIAPGLAPLDLLDGSAVGAFGGSSRHRVDLEGGWFNNGLGFRAIAAWQSGSTVTGSAIAPDLRFSSLTTLNLRVFLNFDQRKSLIEDVPFLKGSRLAIRIDNVFDAIRDVRDSSGATPFRYQPGYVDPLGRTVTVSFRKLF